MLYVTSMGRFDPPVFCFVLFFSKKTIYLDFKLQRNVLYRCHGNVFSEEKCDVRNR